MSRTKANVHFCGKVSLMKRNMALSGGSLMRFRITNLSTRQQANKRTKYTDNSGSSRNTDKPSLQQPSSPLAMSLLSNNYPASTPFSLFFDVATWNSRELAHGEVRRHQVLLLINVRDVGARVSLADHRDSLGVLAPNALCFRLALLWWFLHRTSQK